MTQEEKQLLLIDLYRRIPNGVKIATSQYQYGDISTPTGIVGDKCYFGNNPRYDGDCPIEYIKPYLRPMSSMTDEEVKEFHYMASMERDYLGDDKFYTHYRMIDWLYAHHFDFRGLIPMGLALKAKEGIYD